MLRCSGEVSLAGVLFAESSALRPNSDEESLAGVLFAESSGPGLSPDKSRVVGCHGSFSLGLGLSAGSGPDPGVNNNMSGSFPSSDLGFSSSGAWTAGGEGFCPI